MPRPDSIFSRFEKALAAQARAERRAAAEAKGLRTTTISVARRLMEAARTEAKAKGRTLSAQLEIWIQEKLTTPTQPLK